MKNKTCKTLAVAALLCPALMIVGCTSDGEPTNEPTGDTEPIEAPTVALAEPVTIVQSKSGNSQALDFGVVLIKTQAQYDALGDAEIYPGVDFDKNDLVIAALGQRNTGGYAIKITAIQQVGDELAVTGKATAPGPDDIVTQALTYPYDAAVIENTTATSVMPYID